MKTNLKKNLNDQQIKAVKHEGGPCLILAGAGSGKTRVLTYKVIYLIEDQEVQPSSIVMMTFTNKAAREMQIRVPHTLGFIGTFHSFCAKILRKEAPNVGLSYNYVIYDEGDSEVLLKNILKKLVLNKKITPSYAKHRISSAKDNLITPQGLANISSTDQDKIIAEVYNIYQKKLTKLNAVDFDDLIMKVVELFRDNPKILSKYHNTFHYFLVDEFQDTNAAQYYLAQLLAKRDNNITAVGDFSQSIYAWRGADIQNLERFETDFNNAKIYHLEKNYRSTKNVLEFAHDVIEGNNSHPILELYTENEEGEEITIKQLSNEQEEAIYIVEEVERLKIAEGFSYDDCAVLYRMNAQSRVIEEAFLHYGIPYVLIGGTRFYERKEIKDILAYLRLLLNPEDEVSKERAIKLGKRRFKKFSELYSEIKPKLKNMTTDQIIEEVLNKTSYLEFYDKDDPTDSPRLENIKELKSVALGNEDLVAFLHQIALVESEYSENERHNKGKSGVRLMTLHQTKGLEFPAVFVTGVEEGILPHSRSMYDKQELEEERRLLYVGVTRAKKRLYLTYTNKRFLFGRRTHAQVSRFIQDQLGEEHFIKTF